jgi:DNA-binding NtrC family response regulator
MGGLVVLYFHFLARSPSAGTVLLVESIASLQEIIKEGLTDAGFHVICAAHARHAAHIIHDHGERIDLLLADINALGGRPLDCLKTIKPPQQDLPVLLISAHDRQSLCERHGDLLKTYEFLPIPFELTHLSDTIKALMQLHSPSATEPLEESCAETVRFRSPRG